MAGRRPLVWELVESALVAVVLALFARTFLVQAFSIPTASMAPNLLVGDHLLVNKFVFGAPARGPASSWLPTRAVARGDVVVFRSPREPRRDYIKRCVALPGEVVEIRAKRVFVDGRALDERGYVVHDDPRTFPNSPLLPEELRRRDNFGPARVPAGQYFVLGDNRDNSQDSRSWGPVPGRLIKGRALLVYWSVAPPPAGPSEPAASRPWGPLARTRWQRSLRPVR